MADHRKRLLPRLRMTWRALTVRAAEMLVAWIDGVWLAEERFDDVLDDAVVLL
jgi:hypothetical protein